MSIRRFRDWGVRDLVTAWVLYWVAVLLVFGFPAIRDYVLLQLNDGHGTVSLGYDGSPLKAALVLCGPPIGLALLWALTRPRPRPASGDTVAAALPEPAPDFGREATTREKAPRRAPPGGTG
jgi:hypothetical protein